MYSTDLFQILLTVSLMSLKAKAKKIYLLSDPVWEVRVPFSYPVSSSFFNLKWSSWVFNDTFEEYRPFIL